MFLSCLVIENQNGYKIKIGSNFGQTLLYFSRGEEKQNQKQKKRIYTFVGGLHQNWQKKPTAFQFHFYIQTCLHNFCIWKASFVFEGKMVLVRKDSLPKNKFLLYSSFLV